ncbi:MAG: alpha/beta hydrolase [Dehalococcoidia bacterium]
MLRILALIAVASALAVSQARPSHAQTRYLDEVFPSVSVTSNIAYGEAIDEFGEPQTLLLDLYQPSGDTLPERPVLIFVHGGGFVGGSKTNPDIVTMVTRFAKRGYVTASISYRLREGGFPPEQQILAILDAQHDAQAAVRWFRANAGTYAIDADRIAIGGYSAGAATALFAGYNASDPGDSGNPGYASDVSAVIDVSGGLLTPLMETGEPPVLIVHGTNDATVPYSLAQAIVTRAEEVGVTYELHTLDGVGHGKFGPFLNEITDWSSVFLYDHVITSSAAVGGIARPPGRAADAAAVDAPNHGGGLQVTEALVALAFAAGAGATGAALLARRRHDGRS